MPVGAQAPQLEQGLGGDDGILVIAPRDRRFLERVTPTRILALPL